MSEGISKEFVEATAEVLIERIRTLESRLLAFENGDVYQAHQTEFKRLNDALALSEAKLKRAVEQRDGITSSYLHPYAKEIKYQIDADNAELAAITLETGGQE